MQQIRHEEWGDEHGRRDCRRNCVDKVSFLLLLIVCLSLLALACVIRLCYFACLFAAQGIQEQQQGRQEREMHVCEC